MIEALDSSPLFLTCRILFNQVKDYCLHLEVGLTYGDGQLLYLFSDPLTVDPDYLLDGML